MGPHTTLSTLFYQEKDEYMQGSKKKKKKNLLLLSSINYMHFQGTTIYSSGH